MQKKLFVNTDTIYLQFIPGVHMQQSNRQST